ncbi:energy transducer TonB [Flavobacterium sp.]|uniref:energy transducer TonB n=1 Tax=Flavobacterium sp. TaxID=239 RepID=UPI0038D0D9F7
MGLTSLAIKKTLNSSASDKKKSLILATIFYCILLCILYLISFWPPSDEELLAMTGGGGGGGVTVNFGDSELGSGDNFDSKELDVKTNTQLVEAEETPQEDIISEETDADKTDVVIPKNEPVKNPKVLVKPEVVKPVEVKKPVERKVDDAVANLIKGNKKGGDGDDNVKGNKGSKNGDENSKNYDGKGLGQGKYGNSVYGDGTGDGEGIKSGKGSGWGLKGRKLFSNNQKQQTCNEYGIVVVKVYVNRQGNVFKAERAQGTTNTDPCLVIPAIETAKTFKWLPDTNAPETQIGFVVINFKLGN